ncbi:MAG: glycosyltransferase [Nitrospinota bacterium]
MRILYTGPFAVGSLTEARRKALIALGHEVIGLDVLPYLNGVPKLFRKAQIHSLVGPGVRAYNRAILKLAGDSGPEMIYVDNGAYLWPGTVAALRESKARMVHYTSEYFGIRRYWYRHFLKAVHLYDAHVLTFPPSRTFLEERGARKILFTEFGYDPDLHRPPVLTPEEKTRCQADAVFVGHWEPATEAMIRTLREHGVDAKVWGPGWRRARSLPDRRAIRPVYGEEYVKLLASAKICLCFLNKQCDDFPNKYSASRTFEIPAIGSFLLAERTEQHRSYYTEGEEAEFFGPPGEMVEKAKHYLAHEEEREAIARAGHERCLRSGYTHVDRMRRVLQDLS